MSAPTWYSNCRSMTPTERFDHGKTSSSKAHCSFRYCWFGNAHNDPRAMNDIVSKSLGWRLTSVYTRFPQIPPVAGQAFIHWKWLNDCGIFSTKLSIPLDAVAAKGSTLTPNASSQDILVPPRVGFHTQTYLYEERVCDSSTLGGLHVLGSVYGQGLVVNTLMVAVIARF